MLKNLLLTLLCVTAGLLLTPSLFSQTCPGSPGCPPLSFEAPKTFAMPGGLVEQVASADFDNDGNPDLVAVGPGGTFVFYGNGAGEVGSPTSVSTTPSRAVAVGNLNGDSFPDIVSGSQIFFGSQSGQFAYGPILEDDAPFWWPADWAAFRTIVVANFNPAVDEFPDIAYKGWIGVGAVNGFRVVFGDGQGNFSNSVVYSSDSLTGSSASGSMSIGDLNGDGILDVVISRIHFEANPYWSFANIFLGQGDGTFVFSASVPTSENSVIADFNLDGFADLAGFGFGPDIPGPDPDHGDYLRAGEALVGTDLGNGSGITFSGDGQLLPYYWFGRFTTESELLYIVYLSTIAYTLDSDGRYFSGAYPSARLTVADFNYDGLPDLADSRGVLHIRANPNEFAAPFLLDVPGYKTSVAVVDLNNDLRPDVIVGNTILINNAASPLASTPTGGDVTVQANGAVLTFDSVTSGGITSVKAIDPTTVGDVPGGFAVADIAFEITTTAEFAGTVTSCFSVPTVNDEQEFAALRVLHKEGNQLIDRTSSHDFGSRTICATTTSFSPFYLAKATNKAEYLFDRSKAYKAGSTVPIKLRLRNEFEQNISSSTLPLYVRSLRRIGGNTTSTVNDPGESNPDYQFRFTDSQYHYNLKTTGLAPGRYVLSYYAGSDFGFFYTVVFEIR